MCCKHYHIIFSTFSLKFKCKICVQKEVIHNFKNHILVTWPATNFLAGLKNQITIILFKIWPTNRFSKTKSYNFHFHKNDVRWPLSTKWPIVEMKYVFNKLTLILAIYLWFTGFQFSIHSDKWLTQLKEHCSFLMKLPWHSPRCTGTGQAGGTGYGDLLACSLA